MVCGRNAGAGNRLGAGTSRSSIWPVEAGLRSVSTAALCGLRLLPLAPTSSAPPFGPPRARTAPDQQGPPAIPTPPPPPAARLTELPKPVFTDDRATLYLGDAVELLPLLPEASIDALV